MPDETGTKTTRSDAPGADKSPFGDTADETPASVAAEQDSTAETPQEPESPGKAGEQNAVEETSQDGQAAEDAGDEAAPQEKLKVVVSIKGDRATIGVQQPSSDPHIETVDDLGLSGVVGEVPAVIERARAKWKDSPKHPAYARPAPPARRRNRGGQGSAQNAAAEEGEQAQQQTLRLF